MSEVPHIRPELQALQGYLDGELSPAESREVEARLAAEPDLRRQLEGVGAEFSVISALVDGELNAAAAEVHEARFEQIWDAVQRDLDDAAVKAAGPAPSSVWTRVSEFVRNARVPLGLAGAGAIAALVMFVVVNPTPDASVAQNDAPTESEAPPATAPSEAPAETEPPTRIADADALAPEPLPAAESNDADVERIEFGGASGRISKIEGVRGTTTVIWIEEDEEPIDSEQSL